MLHEFIFNLDCLELIIRQQQSGAFLFKTVTKQRAFLRKNLFLFAYFVTYLLLIFLFYFIYFFFEGGGGESIRLSTPPFTHGYNNRLFVLQEYERCYQQPDV